MPYPRVTITFCTKCKWNLRAAWYLQELLQTFGSQLGEVALIPGPSGCFEISTVAHENAEPVLIWERVRDGGFPDSKVLKQRVRDVLFPDEKLGHVDGTGGALLQQSKPVESSECVECNNP
ncbi:SelT/SelW/SelH family protein CYBJADRAFT_168088 [Cyberlindnera jadinii NRRL Y-1542]|uniref:Uncharacterized protein n=1 Tax=Cyberlindnera jadinii (strain ATCC 18201 / CBS 1600 / BCRC 20928 / JCM 3617 / NBRC 0987 / NRRL Y-1542) TaxID=983966 RepID=A0A1E4S0K2_CYBJN|nr:hypothetical protein CYBJADRAFT_168088 [Cyberlindnera jadinii NRRL Y-1542]ODV73018.1 hypothetical protein CYBJADRAFT_168088 [Cyberlindnera jadinii NRRL Y-1542]